MFTYLGCKKFFSISGEIRYLPQTTKLIDISISIYSLENAHNEKRRKISNIYFNYITLKILPYIVIHQAINKTMFQMLTLSIHVQCSVAYFSLVLSLSLSILLSVHLKSHKN